MKEGFLGVGYFKLASFLLVGSDDEDDDTPLGKPIALCMGNTTEGKCTTLSVMRERVYDCDDGL